MTQDEALAVLKTGGNVFLTGEPGSGKTHTLNRYIEYLKNHRMPVAVTASTGIAATHIGGMTIHAWSGIGIKDELTPYDLDQITQRERVVNRVKGTSVLVIDEVSMLDARVLEMVEEVVRTIKGNGRPFGGIQVVLVGDFFQLPPIARRGERARFAFTAPLWNRLEIVPCYLTDQYRHDDEMLASLLGAIRRGEVDEGEYSVLESCKETTFKDGIEPTRLYTHNANVDQMNDTRLQTLAGEAQTFFMHTRGPSHMVESLKKSCISPEELVLKTGAMVMCTKNNFEAGYVNGTLGQVVDYEDDSGDPVIETLDGRTIAIHPTSWAVEEDGKVLAEVSQIPLRLAWAITIHKSQGMTLDASEMDLSNAFEYGQGYVALSRVRNLSGLLLRGCNAQALQVHPEVLAHDVTLREQSDAAQEAFDEMDEAEVTQMHERFITASGGTLAVDTSWKENEAPEPKVPTHEQTRALVEEGKDLSEICATRELKEGTIIDHLEKLINAGSITAAQVEKLMPQDKKGEQMVTDIVQAFEKEKSQSLTPVFKRLGKKYSYDDIKRVRLLVMSQESA